jgi:hypothetical protein
MQSFAERIREMGGWGMALLFVMVGTSRFPLFVTPSPNERTLTLQTDSDYYRMESSPRIAPTLIRIRILNDNDRLHIRILAWSFVGCCG